MFSFDKIINFIGVFLLFQPLKTDNSQLKKTQFQLKKLNFMYFTYLNPIKLPEIRSNVRNY